MWTRLLLVAAAWLGISGLALAISPYYQGNKLPAGPLAGLATTVEARLKSAGFQPVGRYFPKGLPEHGVVIATHPRLQAAAAAVGRHAILASVVRVGIQAGGEVSWTNPDYWGRAYLRDGYDSREADFARVRAALKQALGEDEAFGGDESAKKLADYRYMIGMEKLDSARARLAKTGGFVEAVSTVREHLANGTEKTARVYEVVLPDARLAVFGVALNDETRGDAVWLSKIKMLESIAGLPYEIYVVGDEILAPFARFRVALAFPDVSMGKFMRISGTPGFVHDTLKAVAGIERKPGEE